MYFTNKNSSEKRENLVKKIKINKILKFPGAYNPLTAKLITEINFDGVYISGAVTANDLGLPDIGLTTLKEVSYRAKQIARVTDLPSIVDADTGFGDCAKTVKTFEKFGLAGCHIEDQIEQKRCGHLDNKKVISKNEMVKKIKKAVKAKKDKNFLIIARSDANAVEGLSKTIERIKAYEDAGADIIFPEAMKNEKEFEKIRKITKVGLLANMTEFGKSKILSSHVLENLGYQIVIYPVTTQRLAMKNVEDGLRVIMRDGHQNNIIGKMQTRKRLYELVEYEKYNSPNNKITDFKTDEHE
ncbi:MAG: methylisocitrate lyase [Pelagibacterales bacterium]|nr:methylisocitrate lyase [Pelagibacterales bacterium]